MNDSPNKRQLQSIETATRLLETAVRLITDEGYNNVSVNRICRESGVGKGTFYLYFKSKSDILFRILADVNTEMFSKKIWETNLPPNEQLLEYTDYYLGVVTEHGPDFSKEVLKIIIDEFPDPLLVESNLHSERITKILDAGKKAGVFKNSFSTKSETTNIQSLLFGLIMYWSGSSGAFDIRKSGKDAVKTYISGLLTKK